MQNKRIFVSGGAGVIGTILVQRLLEEQADVFVGDLKPCPKQWVGKVKYRQGDLNTLVFQEIETFAPEIFFHLAASFERSEENYPFFEENFHHNIRLSHHLMQCMAKSPALKQVIFASSYLIYDPSLYLFQTPCLQAKQLKEKSAAYPRNICGAAKFYHELELRFLENFWKDKILFASARIFRAFGRHSCDVISRWIRAAIRQEPLTVYNPEGKFDYIFADDVAEGLLRLGRVGAQGIVNLGSGKARSIAEVIQILCHHFPELKYTVTESTPPYECSEASIEHLIALTGWQPLETLETAIFKLIEFEKQELIIQKPTNSEHSAVLVTSISQKMPLIEAVRTAVNKLGQFQELHGCDSNALCIGQYGVDRFWHCPVLEEEASELIISYCKENFITAIVPTRNGELEFYARHFSLFQKNGIHLMISPLETVKMCLDKKRFADFLLKHSFPAIPTFLSLDELQCESYVVKERKGAGSLNIGINLDEEAAAKQSRKIQAPIFQPYLKGQEWSVDLYRSFEGKVKGCVARQRNLIVDGEAQVTTTSRYPALEDLCHQMADLLNLHGHAVFQILENDKGDFHVIECNPRFGGASTASISVGLDSFFWFFAECLGLSLHDYPFMRLQEEIRQIRYATDRVVPWPSFST